jgi:hemin uptake protein HemP
VIAAETRRPTPRREPAEAPPTHDARELTGGGTEAEIRLDGVPYVLRITRRASSS